MIYPWNRAHLERLWSNARGVQSALLLAGPRGLGKRAFADAVARSFLCSNRQAEHEACGNCRSCQLLSAQSHPDIRVVEPLAPETSDEQEPASAGNHKTISVDSIRSLTDFLGMSSHLGGNRVVVIRPADRLHPSAGNALLKVLEEPPTNVVFILVSDRPQQLLPTIRSRTYRVDFHYPDQAEALGWLNQAGVEQADLALAQAGGAPLSAADLAESTFWERRQELTRLLSSDTTQATDIVRAVSPDEAPMLCGLLYTWCYDLLALRLGGRIRYNLDCAKPLRGLAVKIEVIQVQAFLKEVAIAARYLDHPLNQRLVCERLAINYTRAMRADTPSQSAQETV